jgi:hypothetical protein
MVGFVGGMGVGGGGEGVDDRVGKVAVCSGLATGEGCTAEFVAEAGVSETGIGLVRVQATRRVVRLNKTKLDRSSPI